MHDWQDTVIRHMASLSGVSEALTAGLLLFAWFVLPRHEHKQFRLPLVLLLLHLAINVTFGSLGKAVSKGSTIALLSQLILLVALARIGFLVVVDWLVGKRLGKPIPRIFRDILQALLFIAIALILFRSMGVELGSLLTTSAILTAVIGLSLQESLGNLVAGLAVRAEHPFEIGDWIEIGEGGSTLGRVVEINWRATKIRTNDVIDIVVPNGLIAKSTISNYSRPSRATRRIVSFQGPYEIPPDRVKSTILAALRGSPGVASTPTPRVWLASFGSSGIDYSVVYFLDDFGARDAIESDIRTRIWYGLKRTKINIPFPICDVRMQPLPGAADPAPTDFDTPDKAQLLAQIPLFSAVPEAVLRQLADASIPELFAAGERIVHEGDAGHELFIVASGEVTVITENALTGERCTLASLNQGQVFGELSLVTGIRGATVMAASESILLRLGLDDFRRIVSQVSGLGEVLLTQVVERQEQLGRPENLGLDPMTPNGALRGALFDKIRRFFSQTNRSG